MYLHHTHTPERALIMFSGGRYLFLLIGPVLVLLIYDLIPVPFEPVEFHLPGPPYHGDSLPENTHLKQAHRILEGLVQGPESLALHNGDIFSGTADGEVIRIKPDLTTEAVVSLDSPDCANETTCGRPLGIRFGPDGFLYVIDAYQGLFKVNISTGEKSSLVSGGRYIDSKPIVFFNDLDVGSDGSIYFTHSSTTWHRYQHLALAMEGKADGRLLKYDPSTEEISVLLDSLALANGVQLSKDESFLLVAEGGRMRIHKYFLKGPRQGQAELFAGNLPGFVDNIRPSSGGGFWVALPTIRRACLYDYLGPRPGLRRFLLKFLSPATIFGATTSLSGQVMELNEEGGVLQRLDDPSGEVVSVVSEVLDTGSHLYLGSYSASYLARVKLSDI